jgi:hypothetical protein
MEKVMTDHINPDHYNTMVIEPIDYILENKLSFCAGAIVKYVSRAGKKIYPGKDRDQSEIADLEKVIKFAQMRINYLNGDDIVTGEADNPNVRAQFTFFPDRYTCFKPGQG